MWRKAKICVINASLICLSISGVQGWWLPTFGAMTLGLTILFLIIILVSQDINAQRKMYLKKSFRRTTKWQKKACGSRNPIQVNKTNIIIIFFRFWFFHCLPIGHITEVREELFERLGDFQKNCSDKNLRKQFPRNGLIFFQKLNQNN